MENLARGLISASNAAALFPFYWALGLPARGARARAALVAVAALASAAFHAVESERACLDEESSAASATVASWLLVVDRVAALVLIGDAGTLWFKQGCSARIGALFGGAGLLLLASEAASSSLVLYCLLHCAWHASAFLLLGLVYLLEVSRSCACLPVLCLASTRERHMLLRQINTCFGFTRT